MFRPDGKQRQTLLLDGRRGHRLTRDVRRVGVDELLQATSEALACCLGSPISTGFDVQPDEFVTRLVVYVPN